MNDSFSWLDGGLVVAYILGSALVWGGSMLLCLMLGNACLGRWQTARLHHLIQGMIPMAGCGVFLGLSALTVNLLKHEGLSVAWATDVRVFLLAGAALWSAWLSLQIIRRYTQNLGRIILAMFGTGAALCVSLYSWALFFW
jgi:hypothetical protein